MSDVDAFITAGDVQVYDKAIAPYDCWATSAHVRTLERSGIVAVDDATAMCRALREVEEDALAGNFPYDPTLGAQLSLEKALVEKLGPQVGYQVHTGRSRNDQVLVAQRLYIRDRVLGMIDVAESLVLALIDRARTSVDVVMPGYTHMQPARPTSFGQWCAAYADLLSRDIDRLMDTYRRFNLSPLGSAESYGTSWKLDREFTAGLLAFDGIEEVPMAAISGRGQAETDVLVGLNFLALNLSKMAQDLMLFTTFEYGFVELGAAEAQRMGSLTGSSIMPQKRNPDVLELIRAYAGESLSSVVHCFDTLRGLPMGYNRDSRDTKVPAMRGLERISACMAQMRDVVSGLVLKVDRMRAVVDANYSMATELAEYLAQQSGIPYRAMYKIVGTCVDALIRDGRPMASLSADELMTTAARLGQELAVDDGDVARALDAGEALLRRDNAGGASPRRMEAWVAGAERRAGETAAWVSAQRARIERSRSEWHSRVPA
jgi:argininosuccinate lyase